MNEQTFEQKLAELVAQTFRRQQEFSEMFNNVGETIDFVRIGIKYLLFDLEATRREKQQLLRMFRDSMAQPDGDAVEE